MTKLPESFAELKDLRRQAALELAHCLDRDTARLMGDRMPDFLYARLIEGIELALGMPMMREESHAWLMRLIGPNCTRCYLLKPQQGTICDNCLEEEV